MVRKFDLAVYSLTGPVLCLLFYVVQVIWSRWLDWKFDLEVYVSPRPEVASAVLVLNNLVVMLGKFDFEVYNPRPIRIYVWISF